MQDCAVYLGSCLQNGHTTLIAAPSSELASTWVFVVHHGVQTLACLPLYISIIRLQRLLWPCCVLSFLDRIYLKMTKPSDQDRCLDRLGIVLLLAVAEREDRWPYPTTVLSVEEWICEGHRMLSLKHALLRYRLLSAHYSRGHHCVLISKERHQ